MLIDISDLEPDAQKIIKQITARVRAGQKQYGALELKNDPRNMIAESIEEILDLTVYLTCQLEIMRESYDRRGT